MIVALKITVRCVQEAPVARSGEVRMVEIGFS